MKVLIVGESPYNLTSNGRMCSDVIEGYLNDGEEVGCAAWAYDKSWYLPDEDGYWYEKEGKRLCRLFPFVNAPDKSSPQVYDIMKSFQPDIVITIGDFDTTCFVFSIKALYPDFFKWVAIMPISAGPIDKRFFEAFSYMDVVIVTNSDAKRFVQEVSPVQCELIHYGPDENVFYRADIENDDKDLNVIYVTQNTDRSNIGNFICGVNRANNILFSSGKSSGSIKARLHTNLYDKGFYDVRSLVNEYGQGKITLPELFVSINDGIPNEKMADFYRNSDIVIDCSADSATGLTLLEGIKCGCVPVGTYVGAAKDMFLSMGDNGDFHKLKGIDFIGREEKIHKIISQEELAENLLYWYYEKTSSLWKEKREDIYDVTRDYLSIKFLEKVKDIVSLIRNKDSYLVAQEI